MKSLYTLIVLLGLAMGMMLTGCNKDETAPAKDATPPTTAPSTNAPK